MTARTNASGLGPAALEAVNLSKRYGSNQALLDCTLTIPAGRVAALVGPNGSGKTTFLHLVVGLLEPTSGEIAVFGDTVGRDAQALTSVAFLAQDKPLYRNFRVREMLRFGRDLNPRWNGELARQRLDELEIPLDRKVGRLSGGQQTQVALTLALAKQPSLLVLDEPLADLDPLARHDVTRHLMAAVAETGLTVLLSSHVVPDLADTCDWLVVLNRGRLQVSGDIDELLASHHLLVGPADGADAVAAEQQVVTRHTVGRQASLLVRGSAPAAGPDWTTRPVELEELVLTYLRDPAATALQPAMCQN
ncbi:ABC transporter ATP-binding protein [Catellatospora methionotrophica]|uniref:ABC transporter ATP-binding protein n=1 Tax=Catellatospora methionotrophica TaxID=121620 RepID=A0A8J3L4U6_9ACTN|nr:ABC transporter ATP-binding protein [Catellatospora methionotrophica]GIG12410.1 ABC transporter ATP-binding protein [Catellatospora methionotrophica]